MTSFTSKDPDRIPCSVVAPVLEYAFSHWIVWRYNAGWDRGEMQETVGHEIAASLASAEHGGAQSAWAKKISRILNCEYETCSLNTVDKLLVTLGMHQLWYVPPLADYYFSPEVLAAA